MKKFAKLIMLSVLFMIVCISYAVGQDSTNPIDIIDAIKDVGSWGDIVGLYEMILGGLVLITTQLAKYVPKLNQIKGIWLGLLVTVIIVVVGILKFGVESVGNAPVIWLIATFLYDKFVKKDDTAAVAK